MFQIQLCEGKDRPRQLPSPPQNQKTSQLLLDLCTSLYGSGKIVVLDSGFSVLKGLIALKKLGVFAHAVAKKRRYWPKYVPGEEIDRRMEGRPVGATDALKGQLEGEPYNIFVMKEPDYCMKLMSTYGGLTTLPEEPDVTRVENGEKKIFKYTKNFSFHFRYRHMVDDHNNLRHSTPSFEDTWKTNRWENRVFAFLLAITEVNIYLYLRWKIWRNVDEENVPTLHQFRKRLAFALIDNQYIIVEKAEAAVTRSTKPSDHKLRRCPNFAKTYMDGRWILSAKSMYQQYRCRGRGCKKMVRTYCECSPGVWMCNDCYSNHCYECATSDDTLS